MRDRNRKIVVVVFIIATSMIQNYILQEVIDSALLNVYKLLYIFPIIYCSFYYGFRGGVITSVLVSLFYSPSLLLSFGFSPETLKELTDIFLFFAVGITTGITFEKKDMHIKSKNIEISRLMILEQYSSSIIQSLKSGVITVNNDLLTTMVNRSACEILNKKGCLGQQVVDLLPLSQENLNELDTYETDKKSFEIEINNEGVKTIVLLRVFKLSDGKIRKGYVFIFDDITELLKLQTQMQRNDRLAALGVLAAGVAHEIRNPLAIIKAVEQTMKKEFIGNNEAIKAIDIIDEEVERANNVVKALMDFARPGKREVITQSVEYVIEEVIAITEAYCSQSNVSVQFERGQQVSVPIDREQIKQAFVNIILNAVQAMPQGGTIKISTLLEKEYLIVSFEDTGLGIDQETLGKIFDPFFTTKEEGTGLGLPIVNRIIEEHGGLISVISKKEIGTTFEIRFPLK